MYIYISFLFIIFCNIIYHIIIILYIVYKIYIYNILKINNFRPTVFQGIKKTLDILCITSICYHCWDINSTRHVLYPR